MSGEQGPGPEVEGKFERPTRKQVIERANEILNEVMQQPDDVRNWLFLKKRDALRDLIEDFDSQRSIVEEHYPGYELDDIKELAEALPDGVGKEDAYDVMMGSYLMDCRMAAFIGKKIDPEQTTADDLKQKFDPENPLLKQLNDADWERVAELIRDNPGADITKLKEVIGEV